MKLKTADYLTIANFLSGFAAIIFAVEELFLFSALSALLGVVFDFLDGKVARWTKSENDFGKQLDSFADLVTFGIWPSIFGYMLGLDRITDMIILGFFSVCGMLRLARFNVTKIKHFEGVPITTNGYLFPLIYILGIFGSWTILIYLAMGLLMVSRLKVKKI